MRFNKMKFVYLAFAGQSASAFLLSFEKETIRVLSPSVFALFAHTNASL